MAFQKVCDIQDIILVLAYVHWWMANRLLFFAQRPLKSDGDQQHGPVLPI